MLIIVVDRQRHSSVGARSMVDGDSGHMNPKW